MKIALIVGHNEVNQGAYSPYLKMTEYEYGLLLANALKDKIRNDGVEYKIFTRKFFGNNRYGMEMKDVLRRVEQEHFDLVLELHFNSWSTNKPNGSMGILFYKNEITLSILEKIQDYLHRIFGTKKRDNIKVRGYNSVDDNKLGADPKKINGSYGVVKCKYKYILLEPFFGSNEEAIKYGSYIQVAQVIHNAIIGERI